MFKSYRWRSEKNRIKVVFRLKFHVTQAFQFNREGVSLSLIPGDVGKPTARSEKAVVNNGQCKWDIPVYETVKFLKDTKTGKVNQRVYHLIVSTTGSAKAGLVGETEIDFADYVDAFKTCNVSLPLQNSNSKALLHVSIQRQLEFDDPQRDVDESDNLGKISQGRDLKSHLSVGSDADETHEKDTHEEGPFGKAARFAELRHRASLESNSTMSSSGSVCDPSMPEEVAKSMSHPTKNLRSAKNLYEEPRISESEWSGSSDHGISADDSTNSSNDTVTEDTGRNSSDEDEIEKLKNKLTGLTRQADLSELELQSLRKQIVKENKRSQDLLREVNSLKQERDSLKEDCERHKVSDKQQGEAKMRNRLQFEGRDPWVLLEETREELDYEKDRNFNLRLQLQKTQESNSELILAVQDLEAMLDEKSKEEADLPRPKTCDNIEESRSETDEDEDQKALEDLVKGHMDAKDIHIYEQKIKNLYNEIEIYKRDKDELEIQMEQLALDYEILKQENHDISYKLEQSQLQEQLKMQYECSSSLVNVTELENQVESLETELKNQSEELSESLCRIKELESQMEILEEELEKQSQAFEADIDAVMRVKVEQEQRAIQAEETLRKTRWRNASVAGKLQDDFKRLSEQMDSMFASNEIMAKKAMSEGNELRTQKRQLEEMLKNANEELRVNQAEYEAKLHKLSQKMEGMVKNLDEKSNDLENQKRHEEDVTANLNKEITILKEEIEILKKDKSSLLLEAQNLRDELEKTRQSVIEAEASILSGNTEKNKLESKMASMKEESESLAAELLVVKAVKDEKETTISQLQSELETVGAQCSYLQHSLSENDFEMEKNKHQMTQVKDELKKKEEAMSVLEKKLKESKTAINNLTKSGQRSNIKGSPSKDVAVMKDKIKHLEGQIKMKETALEASSNKFIEKEKNLKNRIEELETKLDQLNQNSQEISEKEEIKFLVAEIETLRNSNEVTEMELKDMQERYSEISLRFAEVEGVREQLVMTVRNLKNGKRS